MRQKHWSSATDLVLATPELLTLILSCLPVRDLLLAAPLVNKTWNAITLSPIVQRALFFQPDPSLASPIQNPLLVELFPPFFAEGGEHRRHWPGTAQAIMKMPWARAPEAFQRKNASWRRMLLTQPPARKMTVIITSHHRMADAVRTAVVDHGPLRMGQLYDVAVPLINRVSSSFCVRWHTQADRDADLTLLCAHTIQCCPASDVLERKFFSEEFDTHAVGNLKFGERVLHPH